MCSIEGQLQCTDMFLYFSLCSFQRKHEVKYESEAWRRRRADLKTSHTAPLGPASSGLRAALIGCSTEEPCGGGGRIRSETVGVLRLKWLLSPLRLRPHVCLIVPAARVETEVWQRARWVIRLLKWQRRLRATAYIQPTDTTRRRRSSDVKLSSRETSLQPWLTVCKYGAY